MDKRLPKTIADKKELYTLLESGKQLYIYGAGTLAKVLFNDLPLSANRFFEGALVTNLEGNPLIIENTLKVYAANNENINRNGSVLVAVGHRYVEEIVNYLYGLGYTSVFVLSGALENELLAKNEMVEMEDRIKQCIWRITPHPILEYLVINIVDHCNLNCAGCDHFSPIAEKRYVSVERVKKDVERLHDLLSDRVKLIWVEGGEPLLHPEVSEILKIVRHNFQKSELALLTNGTLLFKQSENFWKNCHELDVLLHVTKYPIKADYETAERLAKKHKVRYEYYAGGDTVKTLYHIPLDISGSQDTTQNFMDCSHAQICNMLSEGKLYPCTVAPNIHIFNKKFGTNIPLTEFDGIDIYECSSGNELLDRLAKPMPVCSFCNIKGRTYGHPYRTSDMKMEEWV